MNWLFTQTINGVESWVNIYQSAGAFETLIKEIFAKHNLYLADIEDLTPGSNVVFKVGDKVIKIFAPIEAGFTTGEAYHVEKQALIHANNVTESAPNLLFSGVVEDKYLFHYIIMDYIAGQEFNQKRILYSKKQKRNFAFHFKELIEALNISIIYANIPRLTKDDCLKNSRWDIFSKDFCEDRKTMLKDISFDNRVYVHGDIKAANVIISDDEAIHIIDFADSHIAPSHYEWPFIVFGLFGCDKVMMEAYFGYYENDVFYDELTRSLLMHKFGVGILMQICDLTNTPMDFITDVSCLRELLKKCVQNGNTLIE